MYKCPYHQPLQNNRKELLPSRGEESKEASIGAKRISNAEGVPGGVEVGVGSDEARSPTRSGNGGAAELGADYQSKTVSVHGGKAFEADH